LNRRSVGIPRTLNRLGVYGFSSTFIFASMRSVAGRP
jgi:hypothetical protein